MSHLSSQPSAALLRLQVILSIILSFTLVAVQTQYEIAGQTSYIGCYSPMNLLAIAYLASTISSRFFKETIAIAPKTLKLKGSGLMAQANKIGLELVIDSIINVNHKFIELE
ncbi:hypothetical protein QIS74_08547 [Colletotrichum tabaci]|uniref:Uncharacterized protein n=1 Tax=Colletotrichum tabaci TaxID=1209068 RepID=A0AAV9T880_9PEZI